MSIPAWKDINWSLTDKRILRYQTRIYKSAKESNISKVKCLQKRLLKSPDAKLIAVKRVTNLNKSKITTELEGQIYVTDIEKIKLVKRLRLNSKALLLTGGYISKLGKTEKKSLGISTMRDKAKQALCELALKPEWEAYFEIHSYGSRPSRNYQDAMEAIIISLRKHSNNKGSNKYVLDTCISKCFDQIDYKYLLKKLNTLPEIEAQVKAWLKAGIMEKFSKIKQGNDIPENKKETLQGEIISPLLFNIALHGIEKYMKDWICTKPSFTKTNKYSKIVKHKSLSIIRYGNDFVIIHKDENIIREAKAKISKWLWDGPRLVLNEKKTSIRNTNKSFDFLGFTCITITKGTSIKAKLYPSRLSQARLLLKVQKIIINNRNASSYNLINLLYTVILRWANYFRFSECSSIFSKLTHLIFQKLRSWVFRRDTRNGKKVVKQNYFPSNNTYLFDGTKHQDNWILHGKQINKSGLVKENWLPNLAWIKSRKWIKILGNYSPYNEDNLYWRKRTTNKKTWKI